MKKYSIIYADPPWKYDFAKTNNRQIENHYPTMTVEEIKKLPIENISEKDSVLFLWATSPKLIEAIEVMKAWGFNYKTHGIWDKEVIGMGYWFRGQHELLLVGTRGKFSPPASDLRKSSVFREKRGVHSKKPQFYRDYIGEVYNGLKKVELFARNAAEGWDVWGNEVESDLQIEEKRKKGASYIEREI